MYRVFTIFALALFVSTAAGATETISPDSFWWTGLSMDEQGEAMLGATTGYTDGFVDGIIAMDTAVHDAISQTPLTYARLNIQKRLDRAFITLPRPEFTKDSIATYMTAMTKFYSFHPETSDMIFTNAFRCIEDKPVKTCDDLANEYVKLRATSN